MDIGLRVRIREVVNAKSWEGHGHDVFVFAEHRLELATTGTHVVLYGSEALVGSCSVIVLHSLHCRNLFLHHQLECVVPDFFAFLSC